VVNNGKFIHRANLTPGSLHDLASFPLLPLNMDEEKELYLDRG
jgi:hypothetical protein